MRALLWQCSSCSYSRRRSVDSSGEQVGPDHPHWSHLFSPLPLIPFSLAAAAPLTLAALAAVPPLPVAFLAGEGECEPRLLGVAAPHEANARLSGATPKGQAGVPHEARAEAPAEARAEALAEARAEALAEAEEVEEEEAPER